LLIVAVVDEAKEDVSGLVDFLRDSPQISKTLGLAIKPKGHSWMVRPSRTGKNLIGEKPLLVKPKYLNTSLYQLWIC